MCIEMWPLQSHSKPWWAEYDVRGDMVTKMLQTTSHPPDIDESLYVSVRTVVCVSMHTNVHKWLTFQVEAHSQCAVIWRWKEHLISGHYRQSALRRAQSHSSPTLPMGVQAQWDEKTRSSEGGLKHTVSHSLKYKDWHARTPYSGKQSTYRDVNQK